MPMVDRLHSFLVSCQEGDGARVATILQSGEVGVNSSDEGEITGLQVAAANGHQEIVEVLVARGAKLNNENSSGWTALHQASYHGHLSVVKTLLEAGSDVNHHNKYGASALHMAAAGGQLGVTRLLLAAGGKVEEVPVSQRPAPSPAMTAALHGQETVLRLLLESGAKIDKMILPTKWTPLMLSAVSGSQTSAKTLLETGADPQKLNLVRATALEIAIAAGNTGVRDYLSDKTVMETARYIFRLTNELNMHAASGAGDLARVEEILANGESDVDDIDQEGATPLIMAAIGGHLEVVKLLIKLGADVNHRDKVNGWTALMQATFYCHKPVISLLISVGADPTITANNGCTALDLATLVDDEESGLVRLLASTTIEMIPPSLVQARPLAGRRAVSVVSLSDGSVQGGIKGWWERFSGRFKRLNKVLGVESEGRRRMISDNDLHYQHLLPQSPVFTLGFTGLEPHPVGLTPDTPPHFSEDKNKNVLIPESELPLHNGALIRTRKLLMESDSAPGSPASLGVKKRNSNHHKNGKEVESKHEKRKLSSKQVSVLNILKKLRLEQHYPKFVANEVDVLALSEMDDKDLVELGLVNVNDRKAILKSVYKLKS